MAVEVALRLICVPLLRAHPAQRGKPLDKVWLLWREVLAFWLLFLPQNIFDPMWNLALCSCRWHLKDERKFHSVLRYSRYIRLFFFVHLSVCPFVSFFNDLKRHFYLGIKVEMEFSGQNSWKNDFKDRLSVKARASSPVLFLALHACVSPDPSDSKHVAISFVRISFWSKYWFSKVL